MNKSTSYIELLCRCLESQNQGDKGEFEKHFNTYYQYLAGTSESPGKLLKYINFLTYKNSNFIADDVLQNTVIEMYLNIKERPVIATRIKEIISTLNLDSQHNLNLSRDIRNWKQEIVIWIDQIMSFSCDFSNTKATEATKDAKRLNEKLLPIHVNGFELVNWIYTYATDKKEALNTDISKQKHSDLKKKFESIFRIIYERQQQLGVAGLDKELRVEGGVFFIENIKEIVKKSPDLCFRFQNYVKQRAKSKITNHNNLHSTTKSTVIETASSKEDEHITPGKAILEMISPDKISSDDQCVAQYNKESDPTKQFVADDVMALLYTPVTNAIEGLERAKTKQEKQRVLHKIDKCEKQYKQNLEIFICKISGFTQQEIAKDLDLTRDEIRGRLSKIIQLTEPLSEQPEES